MQSIPSYKQRIKPYLPSPLARILIAVLVSLSVGIFAIFGFGHQAYGASSTHQTRTSSTHSPAPPLLTLTSQTPWVTPSASAFRLGVGVSSRAGAASNLSIEVTIYGRLFTRSDLERSLSGTPSEPVLLRAAPVPVTSSTSSGGSSSASSSAGSASSANTGGSLQTQHHASICITVTTKAANGSGAPATVGNPCSSPTAPIVNLDCTAGAGTCDDIYPVTVTLQRNDAANPVASFTTFLTYDEPGDTSSAIPLRFAALLPVATPISINSHATSPANALSTPTNSDAVAINSMLSTLKMHPLVPLTLLPNPMSVQALSKQASTTDKSILNKLSSFSLNTSSSGATAGNPNYEILTQPFVPINLGTLSGSGLGGEIVGQMNLGRSILNANHIKTTPGTAILPSSVGSDLGSALKTAGISQVVIPDTALAPGGSNLITFAQPFNLELTRDQSVSAVASDSLLSSHFTADPGNPVLAANQLLADLSFIHYENAFEPNPRGVVAVPPTNWTPNTSFMSTLLNGLENNPIIAPTTLSQLVAQVPIGGNYEPSYRHLSTLGPGPRLSKSSASALATDRTRLNSFETSIQSTNPVRSQLNDLLYVCESDTLNTHAQAACASEQARLLDSQLALIQIGAEKTIIFTARTAPIPISILSSAPYPVVVDLTISSNKFAFPGGSNRRLVLDHPTNQTRFEAEARTSGDNLPVEVTLTTPDGRLVIAKSTLSVRSTSISLVGILLTLFAGIVLLTWWARTWWRGKAKHGRVGSRPTRRPMRRPVNRPANRSARRPKENGRHSESRHIDQGGTLNKNTQANPALPTNHIPPNSQLSTQTFPSFPSFSTITHVLNS